MTGSGRYFDPLNPTAASVHLPDIARGLKRGVACRFNGQLLDPADCPHPQSCASHSMRVGRLAYWRAFDQGLGEDVEFLVSVALAAVLHDSPEGYVGDRLRPVKNDADRAIETAILQAICDSLLPGPQAVYVASLVHDPIVKWADEVALRQEALIYQPGAGDWALPSAKLLSYDALASTLTLFHPREGESWIDTVRALVELVNIMRHSVSYPAADRLAELMA